MSPTFLIWRWWFFAFSPQPIFKKQINTFLLLVVCRPPTLAAVDHWGAVLSLAELYSILFSCAAAASRRGRLLLWQLLPHYTTSTHALAYLNIHCSFLQWSWQSAVSTASPKSTNELSTPDISLAFWPNLVHPAERCFIETHQCL